MQLPRSKEVAKAPTGIPGFDTLTGGGLPRGRATMVLGGTGAGKTLFALQSLVHAAREENEPGIFVAFEEASGRIRQNAAAFGWGLSALTRRKVFFLDAQPSADWVQSGEFDLIGLVAQLEAKVREIGARRLVLDSVDVVLDLLDDPRARRREAHRLHEWLLRRELTALITAKTTAETASAPGTGPLGYMHFMVDCAVALSHDVVHRVAHRSIRVVKYRGSAFAENATPFVIGPQGLEVGGLPAAHGRKPTRAPTTRVSSGVARLDVMLGGGYHRGASVLITGSPGTAKTSLCGAYVAAACRKGERALFVSFDSSAAEIERNLNSIGVRLAGYSRQGLLRIEAMQSSEGSAELLLQRICRVARAHRATHLVVDPVSALAKQGNLAVAPDVVERLVSWAKSSGLTLVVTSLLATPVPENESTQMQVSTIADTWIHLSYVVHAGERNRALTIVKSRGTAHSNQVRELVLTADGITLTDVYTAGGEVLMGTLRWEREQALEVERQQAAASAQRRDAELATTEAELIARRTALDRQLAQARAERAALDRRERTANEHASALRQATGRRRGADRQSRPTRPSRP